MTREEAVERFERHLKAALRRHLRWLRLAATSAQSAGGGTAEELAALEDGARDAALVAALQAAWPHFNGPLASRIPIGWAGIVMHEGSEASFGVLRPLVAVRAPDIGFDSTIDDLCARCPTTTEPARAFRRELEALLAARDTLTGKNALHAALGLDPPPTPFALKVTISAAKDQALIFECGHDRGSTGITWFAGFGKKKFVWAARQHGIERDGPGFGMLHLADFPRWLRHAAEVGTFQ
jgi:hypothetical protein